MATDDARSRSQARYSRFAQRYVVSPVHAQGTDLDRLVEIAAPERDWIALDVATGGGHTALKFAPHVARVIATDLTPAMLQAAETHIRGQDVRTVSFALADAQDLPFEGDSFDLVTCRIAPHHFLACPRFVRECARVLHGPRPGAGESGGLLLIQDHVLPEDGPTARYVDAFERLRDPSHNRAFAESEWVRMLEDAGLTLTHKEQVIKTHSFASWTGRQDCAPATVERLVALVRDAPGTVTAWMQPQGFGTPEATFVGHHIILCGRKGA